MNQANPNEATFSERESIELALRAIMDARTNLQTLLSSETLTRSAQRQIRRAHRRLSPCAINLTVKLRNMGVETRDISRIVLGGKPSDERT